MATTADKVFNEIVTDILSGSLRPRDTVSERDLVARFGVSRTPVREAIKRLIERGFLEIGPKGMAVVVDISEENLKKLYDLRIRLESHAATLAAANITAAELDELRAINNQYAKAVAKRDLVQMLEVRARFHAITANATRNRWLADILIALRDKAYAVRHLHWQDPERAAATIDMHRQMIAALERGDARAYRQLSVGLIRDALDRYFSQLRPAPGLRAPVKPQVPRAPRQRSEHKAGLG